MNFDFYQKLTALCFLNGGCSIASAALALSRLGIVSPDRRMDATGYLRELAHSHRVVGGFLLERVSIKGDNPFFYLISADRAVRVTDEFLDSCNADWAEEIRASIKTFEEN